MELTSGEPMSSTRLAVAWIVVVIEFIALLFNVLALVLVKRRGLTGLDMRLAVLITISDLILVGYKLIQFILYSSIGPKELFSSKLYGQIDGLLHIVLFAISVNCVGYLAAVRASANCFRIQIIQWRWALTFLIQNGILFGLLVIIASQQEFIIMPFERYFFFSVNNSSPTTLAATWLLILYCLGNIVAVNLFYPWIAYSYIHSLPRGVKHDGDYEAALQAMAFPRHRRNVILKTIFMLILYNLAMVPSLYILLKEQITNQTRTLTEDIIFSCSLMSLTFINPMLLIALHTGIWRLCVVSFKNVKKSMGNNRLWSKDYNMSRLSNIYTK